MRKLLLGLLFFPLLALAQQYPTKPIRMIVPFPAGGPADIFGRGLAQGLTEQLGQPVIVENVGGVGGVLGVDRALKSNPDGYTLGFNSGSTLSIAPFSFAKMPYDVKKDVGLITLVVKVPEVLAVHPSLPVNSLAELVAYAKANPGKVNFGSAGGGSITHLAGELLKAEAKIDLVHVPYKGAAPAVNDLLGGQVQMGIFDVPILLGHIRGGKLKALAVTSARRAATLPDVPTTAEGKYPNVTSDNWYGLIMPWATPLEIQKRLNAAAVAALKSPSLSARSYANVGGVASPSTPRGIRGLPRRRAEEVAQGRERHRLQGRQLALRARLLLIAALGWTPLCALADASKGLRLLQENRPREAREEFERGAASGERTSQAMLTLFLWHGYDRPPERAKACEQAAAPSLASESMAQAILAHCHLTGTFVEQDLQKAHALARSSALGGNNEARYVYYLTVHHRPRAQLHGRRQARQGALRRAGRAAGRGARHRDRSGRHARARGADRTSRFAGRACRVLLRHPRRGQPGQGPHALRADSRLAGAGRPRP